MTTTRDQHIPFRGSPAPSLAGRLTHYGGDPFTLGGSTRGDRGYVTLGTFGYLPLVWQDVLYAERRDVTFTIASYATPIAWCTDTHGWTVPDVRYSVTTSRHQNVIRRALASLGLTYREKP